MKLLFDTSVLIDIDRQNKELIEIMEKLTQKGFEFIISTVSISEFFTGVYAREYSAKRIIKAKEFLMQFKWVEVDSVIAEEAGKIMAYRIMKGEPVDYQDNIIAATFKTSNSDFLLTFNVSHFKLPFLKGKVYDPFKFCERNS